MEQHASTLKEVINASVNQVSRETSVNKVICLVGADCWPTKTYSFFILKQFCGSTRKLAWDIRGGGNYNFITKITKNKKITTTIHTIETD